MKIGEPVLVALHQNRPQSAAEVEILVRVSRVGSSDGRQLGEFFIVSVLSGFGEQEIELAVDGGFPTCHLSGSDVGREQSGISLDHVNPDNRAPGVTEQDNLSLVKLSTQITTHLQTVLDDSVEVDIGRFLAVESEGVTGPSLIPLNDREA